MGGATEDPTYYKLGDHSETVQLDYDPNVISYDGLLEVFFASHDPTASTTCQYKSAIFVHTADQERLAQEARLREEQRLGRPVQTEIAAARTFYLAEEYHQKFSLRFNAPILAEFRAMYPDFADIVNSTAATRVNAYLDGMGTIEQLERELPKLGLSEESQKQLRSVLSKAR